MSEPPEKEAAYCEGHRAGWLAGYEAGKGVGYSDAKVRARLALEAACEHLALSGAQREVLMRCSDNIVGNVK